MLKNDRNLQALREELTSEGISPDDLLDPSRRHFIVSSLRKSTAATAVLKLGLISSFLSVISEKARSQVVPTAFWKRKPAYFCFGLNIEGQLGLGDVTNRNSPVQFPGVFEKIYGGFHAMGLKKDGSLWTWGWNQTGQLGIGTSGSSAHQSSPVQVPGTWIAATSGEAHSIAVRSNNTLWAWGNNKYGRLGNNSTVNRSSPVQVSIAAASWNQLSGGYSHSGALRSDNALWLWGDGYFGQLGIGSSGAAGDRSSPVQVAGTWQSFALGSYISAGLRTNGTLWTWGRNNFGQLGQGNTTNRSSPVQITGSWTQVSVGFAHMGAIRTDGTLWIWGRNNFGQLGQGNTTNRSSPVQVPGSWSQISCGSTLNAGFKTDGTLWVWGDNYYGGLGLGDTTDRSSPVQLPGKWVGFQHSYFVNFFRK